METVVLLSFVSLLLLFIKHYIIDFILQTPFQYLNKGTYGHLGGIVHALNHSMGTTISLILVAPLISFPFLDYLITVIFLSLLDGILHYHMDWVKVKISNRYNYKPSTKLGCTNTQATLYYWWLGFDQIFHNLTYVLISYLFTTTVLI